MDISQAGNTTPLHERVMAMSSTLSPTEYAVAQYLSDHPEEVASATALALGEATGTSNATVVRTIKALGYAGLPELRRALSRAMADRRAPSRVLGQRIDQLGGQSIAMGVLEASSQLLQQTARTLDIESWRTAVDALDNADIVYSYGVEQAGAVAEVFAAQHVANGGRATAIVATGITLARAMLPLRSVDAVLLIAPLRYFREIELVVARANEVGAPVVLVSEALGHALADRVTSVLAMPQSTLSTASEILAPLVIVDALALEISARHRAQAVAHYEMIDQFREAVVGASVDFNGRPSLHDNNTRLRR